MKDTEKRKSSIESRVKMSNIYIYIPRELEEEKKLIRNIWRVDHWKISRTSNQRVKKSNRFQKYILNPHVESYSDYRRPNIENLCQMKGQKFFKVMLVSLMDDFSAAVVEAQWQQNICNSLKENNHQLQILHQAKNTCKNDCKIDL